jgi:hypothetical protein
MSNNIFSSKRFGLLFRQHIFQNSQFLLLSTVAYVGVIFIVLCIAQVGSDLGPHGLDTFQTFLIVFVSVFGLLYVGHAFPAFRSKESTITYLMLPASALEKFVFEFISRIGIVILILPVLYWLTFNFQGVLFGMFTEAAFEPIGIEYLVRLGQGPVEGMAQIYTVITAAVLFALSLAFTGSAMFDKQPLVKSLFAVAVIVMFFLGYSYIVVEHFGVGEFQPPDQMVLIPTTEYSVFRFLAIALFAGTAVMLFVAYRKLKEREV